MRCWAVGADVLDEDSPHHLSSAQSPAHASASHYADTQGLARSSSQSHTEAQTGFQGTSAHCKAAAPAHYMDRVTITYLCMSDGDLFGVKR